jgi:hypothetical protein
MSGVVRGVISLVVGIGLCIAQAAGGLPEGHNGNGYLAGGIIITFGLFRIGRGLMNR